MTPSELIADLKERINPAYSDQRGTESYERRLCVEALEQQAAVIEQMKTDITYAIKIGHIGGIGKTQLERALALQPCPEVLNKLKADAVMRAADYLEAGGFYEAPARLRTYADSLLKGEV